MTLPFSYYNSRGEAAFILVLLLLPIISICRFLADVVPQTEGSAWAWLGVTFLGLCLGVLIWLFTKLVRHILDKSPRLTFTQTGVTDHRLGIGEIPWTDIEGAYVRFKRRNTFICLNLRNEHEYVARMAPTTRVLHSVNKKLGFTPIVLALNGLDANTDEVLATIKSLAAQSR